MKILVTGFTPFGGENINPAYEAVKLLPSNIGNAQVIKIEIPTEFENGFEIVKKAIEYHKPQCVVCIGQAGGSSCISIEKVAINYIDARIADNNSKQPIDCPIRKDGPVAYFSTLPVKAMVENIIKNGVPASLSLSAGSFVCNEVMYQLLDYISIQELDIIGGFIHVPYSISQIVNKSNGTAGWCCETISKGIEYALEAIVFKAKSTLTPLGTIY